MFYFIYLFIRISFEKHVLLVCEGPRRLEGQVALRLSFWTVLFRHNPWPGVSPTAILNEEKALGMRLALGTRMRSHVFIWRVNSHEEEARLATMFCFP